MNKRKQPPQQQQIQQQVDLTKADTIKCDDCGNYLFIASHIIKRLSAIVSPTGQEALVPIQVYSCGNCGTVMSGMLKDIGLDDVEDKTSDLFRPDIS